MDLTKTSLNMFVSKYFCKIWLTMVIIAVLKGPPGCNCSCPVKLDERTVARMCYDSEASGTRVFIDTSGAKATEDIPANVCQCTVSFYNSKLVHINSTSLSSECGSVLEFNRTGVASMLTGQDCASLTATSALQWPSDEMVIALHKQAPPYKTEFCVSLDLVYCNLATEYQCVGGTCIQQEQVCDSFPDCEVQGDDEHSCNRACAEGLVSCADNSGCYKMSQKCDNVTTCSDGSDEQGCKNSKDTTAKPSVTTKKPITVPLIKVKCVDSLLFTTTTSTTTSTTSTTATTTTTETTTSTSSAVTTEVPTAKAMSTFPSSTLSTSSESLTNQTISSIQSTNQWSEGKTSSNIDDASSDGHSNERTSTPLQSKQRSSNIFTHPYVIMAMVIGAIFCLAVTGFVIYFIMQQRKKRKYNTQPQDLWIPNAAEEMEPFNG